MTPDEQLYYKKKLEDLEARLAMLEARLRAVERSNY